MSYQLACLRTRAGTSLLVPSLLVLCGCGASHHSNQQTSSLFQSLTGTREVSSAVLDERRGRLGRLHLGMSFSHAEQLLPARDSWRKVSGPGNIAFCSHLHANRCTGLMVRIVGQTAAVASSDSDSETLGEISVTALANASGDLAPDPLRTHAGLRLGGSSDRLRQLYTVAHVGSVACGGGAPPPGHSYVVATTRTTTLVITVHGSRVWALSLVDSPATRVCT